jgi:hypothetical protein
MKAVFFVFSPILIAMLAFHPVALHTINGKITTRKDFPVADAVITLKGSGTKVISGKDGRFTIEAPGIMDTLIISATGYYKKEISINGRANVNVKLSLRPEISEEVIQTKDGPMLRSYMKIDD